MNKGMCAFNGCVKAAVTTGLCGSHYAQKRQGKELKPLQQQFHGLTEMERFMKWVAKQPDGCWKWAGSKNEPKPGFAYGQWRNGVGKIELAHRGSYRLHNGDFPADLYVLHKCDVPLCVNPDHLFLGTQTDNMKDMWEKGRANPGVVQGQNHGMSKLGEKDVKYIRESDKAPAVLAQEFSVSTTTIYDILNRRIWKHLK